MRKGRGSTETVNTPCPELFAAPLVMHNVQCFIYKKKQTKNTTAVSTSFISIKSLFFVICSKSEQHIGFCFLYDLSSCKTTRSACLSEDICVLV